jgi:DNA-binding NarL/FixJ family response regulator
VSVRVAVLDPLPVYRRGLVATLVEADVIVEGPDDLLAWAQQDTLTVVFLTLQSQSDWQLLADLRQGHSGAVIIAVLVDVSVETYLRALSSGAAAAIPRDAPAQQLRQVFEQAVCGRTVLPVAVVRALTSSNPQREGADAAPSSRELSWLHELARGVTVGRLAEQSGYSERAMFRLLHDLYRRLGVRNRTEALIRAHEQGWLQP